MNPIKILLLFMFIGLASCSPESEKLVPRKDPEKVNQKENSFTFISNVDLLFVIDNSGSMGDHQQQLTTNLNDFAKRFMSVGFIDYHIGVTTSDMYSDKGRLQGTPKFITKNTSDREQMLINNMLVGTRGSAREYFFDPIYLALSDPLLNGYHKDFYRPNALLAIVIITDAEENGSNIKANDLYDHLLDLKNNDPSLILTYGAIVDKDNLSGCDRDGWYEGHLTNFFDITNGTYFDLCSPNFGVEIAQLTDDLLRRVSVIRLKSIPVVNTIEVRYGNTLIPQDHINGWSYDPNLVAIHLGPELDLSDTGEELSISYDTAEVIPDSTGN